MGLVVLHSGHYLEDLPAADGHDLQPEVARGRRARAALGGRPGASDRRRPRRSFDDRARGDVRRAFDIPAPDRLVLVGWFEGGEVFRCGCCYQRGRGRIFYFRPGHETYPTYSTRTSARDRQRRALGGPGQRDRRPTLLHDASSVTGRSRSRVARPAERAPGDRGAAVRAPADPVRQPRARRISAAMAGTTAWTSPMTA